MVIRYFININPTQAPRSLWAMISKQGNDRRKESPWQSILNWPQKEGRKSGRNGPPSEDYAEACATMSRQVQCPFCLSQWPMQLRTQFLNTGSYESYGKCFSMYFIPPP